MLLCHLRRERREDGQDSHKRSGGQGFASSLQFDLERDNASKMVIVWGRVLIGVQGGAAAGLGWEECEAEGKRTAQAVSIRPAGQESGRSLGSTCFCSALALWTHLGHHMPSQNLGFLIWIIIPLFCDYC